MSRNPDHRQLWAGRHFAGAGPRNADRRQEGCGQRQPPALEKQRDKRGLTTAKTFGDMADKWMADARMADSTKAMRKHIVDRDILPVFQNRQLNKITADDLRALCKR